MKGAPFCASKQAQEDILNFEGAVKEGEYTEDYHETAADSYRYAGEGWGFVPQD
ncbi:hypothetical protein ACYULU_11375 [Breznakiellaceae bacterium SP9]